MPTNPQATALRERVSSGVPARPGVYTWLANDGEVLYVGKSVNLRRRMLSYLAAGASEHASRQRHLAYSLSSFRFQETPGELLALLLEDALIKRYEPRHNTRSRDYRERCYLVQKGTTLQVSESPCETGSFGPFKDRHFATRLRNLLEQVFGRPGTRGSLDTDGVGAFLRGEVGTAVAVLERELEAAATVLHYERAANIRDAIGFCQRFGERERFHQSFSGGEVVLSEPAIHAEYRLVKGALTGFSLGSKAHEIPGELSAPLDDARHLRDRGNIAFDWMRANR
ncbi:MAG: GIY-YIG nuclease family protein [Dehalococcoidia bacterium]|nr:GIY-YIG nuclease family protein [Dehalococcoidia bacterium]